MKFNSRNQAIKKEQKYAEKRFRQLLDQVEQIDKTFPEDYIEMKLRELDNQWLEFCKNLIYLTADGKNEFIKIARKIAVQTIKVEL